MNRKIIILFCLSISYAFPVLAQSEREDYEDALEDMAIELEESVEDDSRILDIENYKTHPLDMNTATSEELKTFFFLNELQIQSFIAYRDLMGQLLSVYELQAIPQWDLNIIHRLLPFITIGKKNFSSDYSIRVLLKHSNFNGLLRFKQDVERKKGFKPQDADEKAHYPGPPFATFLRAQYKFPGYLNIGFVAESDAGEPFSGYGQRGFDFYSAHIFLKNRGKLKKFALGDYRINFGQGLINQQGLSFGKTGMVMMIDRSGEAISPHTSAMEFGFYRGTAVQIGNNKWSTTLFASKKPEDANLQTNDSISYYFRSIQKAGYHRTVSEIKNKGSITQFSSGGNIRYDFGKGHLAFNMVYHHFSDSMKKTEQLYQLYNPEGKQMLNASVDYALFLKKIYLFGETAVDKKGALGTVNGLLMSADRNVDISLLYRHYSPSYSSLYSRAFGESGNPQNENGFYAGLTVHLSQKWELNGYADFFKSDWLRYRVDMPSFGKEHFLQLDYKPSKTFRANIRYRHKDKPINVLKDTPLAELADTKKQNIRLFMEWKISGHLILRDQADGVYFHQTGQSASKGYMLYQNIAWKINRTWSGNARVGYFNTDNYDSRIYTYENNVKYAYYIPSFYGKGWRCYINVRMNLGRRLSLWAKISQTRYPDRDKISSGWDEIEGNKQTRFTMELVWE